MNHNIIVKIRTTHGLSNFRMKVELAVIHFTFLLSLGVMQIGEVTREGEGEDKVEGGEPDEEGEITEYPRKTFLCDMVWGMTIKSTRD